MKCYVVCYVVVLIQCHQSVHSKFQYLPYKYCYILSVHFIMYLIHITSQKFMFSPSFKCVLFIQSSIQAAWWWWDRDFTIQCNAIITVFLISYPYGGFMASLSIMSTAILNVESGEKRATETQQYHIILHRISL